MTPTTNPFDGLAPYYDRLYGSKTDDLAYIVEALRKRAPGRGRNGTRVLELGIGTGRVALHLAQVGFRVVGVDDSRGMLHQLEEKLRESALRVHDLVTYRRGDITKLSTMGLDPNFAAVVMADNTYPCLQHVEERRSVLKSAHSLLAKKGILIVDVLHKDLAGLPPQGWHVLGSESRREQSPLSRSSFNFHELAYVSLEKEGRERINVEIREDGIRKFRRDFQWRLLSLSEVSQELAECGFSVIAADGDYIFRNTRPDARLVVTGCKSSTKGQRVTR